MGLMSVRPQRALYLIKHGKGSRETLVGLTMTEVEMRFFITSADVRP